MFVWWYRKSGIIGDLRNQLKPFFTITQRLTILPRAAKTLICGKKKKLLKLEVKLNHKL